MKETGLKRGQPITFRIPSDTSDQTLRQLQKLKEVERRNFSSKIAGFVMDGVNESLLKNKEVIMIPLPKGLNKTQRDWLKHEHSEVLLGSVVYELLSDPIRTAALLASLNSDTIGDELRFKAETAATIMDDDVDDFDWGKVTGTQNRSLEQEEERNPLGDFLAQMNK